MNYCCEDFRITIEEYKHITKLDYDPWYRFVGHHINYCPYCGKKIENTDEINALN
jgi:hypothetical protein